MEAKSKLEESQRGSQKPKWLKLCQERFMDMREKNPKYSVVDSVTA